MISTELLDEVMQVCRNGVDLSALRAAYPGVHFTECAEDDITVRFAPLHETADLAFYLVSGRSGHCLALTPEMAEATGIVIAHKADE